LPVAGRRRRAVLVSLLGTILLATAFGPTTSLGHSPGIDRFLYALGEVESGGRYGAENASSGAYGKYQIMPSSWRAWAKAFLGNADAEPTPDNQETVARAKVHRLYHGLDSWRRVAYWWLTGSSRTTGWTVYATSYVNKVMAVYAGAEVAAGPRETRFSERDPAIEYTGTWLVARYRSYAGRAAKQASDRGETATFTFTGTRVSWRGPKGPTRGRARVYIDGEYVRTVSAYSRRFQPKTVLFSMRWSEAATRVLTIKVLGSRGHPVISFDEFVVRD
jgi:hypothetical protein